MFGLSIWEIAIILGAALLLFGPKKLPELARSLGRGLREFRKATEDFKSTMDAELHAPEERAPPPPKPPTPEKLPETVARAPAYGVEPAELEPDAPEAVPAEPAAGEPESKSQPLAAEPSESVPADGKPS